MVHILVKMMCSSIKAVFYYTSLFLVVVTSCNIFADEQLPPNPVNEEESFFSFLDGTHSYISENVEALARNLDEFFSSDKTLYNSSGTYLRLREDFITTEGVGLRAKGDVKLRLQLPYTQKKMRLSFESSSRKGTFDESIQEGQQPLTDLDEDESFTAELQALVGKEGGWQFKPSIGAYLGTTIDPYVKFNLNRQYKIERWSINWDETPYKIDSIGWGVDSYFELNRKIANSHLFRSASFAGWLEEADQFELSQVFSFNTRLTEKKAISYFAGIYGIDNPKIHTTQFLLGINYRQNIHKDYLFVELKPQVKYERENNFKPEHSMIFRIEMLFQK